MSYEHILVAVDLSQSSQEVIEKAVSLARSAKCKLSFAHVNVDRVALTPKEQHTLEEELQTLAEQCGYPITDTFVVIGDLHIKLSGIVKKKNIDLVVCGHHHKLFSRIFSSIPKLANAVEADLLVVYLNQ
ncbi:universal stress protein [Photobacterium gaetbulicola]|uniref:Universal stress protein n=1 Tax=Photobacterium gaetbulicola Gung47 TaxID=658445 RepID=A0A0C5WJT7_9GAMM|nr:universal stress protein [Photobacterium gaetbulicola]AJR06482.1 putative universal stress protein A [Photobacterium gaetbulicola Gung47]PSU02510.1 universal stress protein [Photobacterium gaetbulicola]